MDHFVLHDAGDTVAVVEGVTAGMQLSGWMHLDALSPADAHGLSAG